MTQADTCVSSDHCCLKQALRIWAQPQLGQRKGTGGTQDRKEAEKGPEKREARYDNRVHRLGMLPSYGIARQASTTGEGLRTQQHRLQEFAWGLLVASRHTQHLTGQQ